MAHDLTIALHAGGERAERAKARVRQALLARHGVVAHACEELGVSTATISRWMRDFPDLAAYAKMLREQHGVAGSQMAAARKRRW